MRDFASFPRGSVPSAFPEPFVVRRKGARMPSIAEDVATDLSTVRARIAGSRRYGLATVSFELMNAY